MTLLSSLKSKASKSDSDSDSDPPPRYSQVVDDYPNDSSSSGGFVPSATLQVEAIGYDTNQALTGRTLENISVFRLGCKDAEYVSIRLKKNSNSCALVRASDETPLISTVYRFGPGRHPRMRILDSQSKVSVEEAIKDDNVTGEQVEVKSRSLISRAQTFDMSFGKFEWRYGKRKERAAFDADNILILERTDSVSLADGGQSKSGARVAHLIRNDEYRTPGSKKYSGGNGGRLFIDLRIWSDDKHTNLERVEAFVVASSILMLKREADRFIDNHIAAVS
ncbi:uncharacterized protein PAN0_002d1456 [Moesziomyces antarcticus]|uniref:Uncharacterized protein n=1 Tax=Pseudozyma antarctica TaxID=84753 RepID=A0A5C3FFY7_PSEA2|nr:uncharacterized protein PAN0_002d1456 [Moesziomyces antarcticus]GAK63252.1 conserved hypothetical protein [Moesziomyces antarcticus]SPO43258.1 uncharacterized protein PSANT_00942 [Moesziomyces antarcticus]